MDKSSKKLKRVFKYAILFIIFYGVLLTFTNLKNLTRHFFEIDLHFFLIAVGFSFLVYLIEGIFLLLSLRLFDERLPLIHALRYSLIINSIGYFVSFGGLTPFATQVHVLDHHDIGYQKATAARVIQVIYFNFFFILLLGLGLISILKYRTQSLFSLPIVVVTVGFFFLLIAVFYLAIFWKTFQETVMKSFFGFLNAVIRLFSKRIVLNPTWPRQLLGEFLNGFRTIVKRPSYLFVLFILSVVDWSLWISVIYFCFRSMNYPIHFGVLVIGFSIGQIVGILSMLPGGAGAMEGSMALVYSSLSVHLATAVGAILLYRLAFYVIPFLACLPFYFSLRHRKH
jgi:uncharacterized protein (TIRG00374 family)